jgi:hypothetical protein
MVVERGGLRELLMRLLDYGVGSRQPVPSAPANGRASAPAPTS